MSQCKNDGDSKILDVLFLNQSKWVKGNTIEEINQNLKKFLKSEGVNLNFNKCTTDKNIEDFILNDRIEGVKKFKVNATPTIIINGKKFEKSLNYKNLKKTIEKLI
jgi:protein-disulfide isomerase